MLAIFLIIAFLHLIWYFIPLPHEKPYFPSPAISWKAQKHQLNIIYPSTSWLKKDHISHLRKVQNKNLIVVSKNGIHAKENIILSFF